RNEQGLLDAWIELAQESARARASAFAQRHGTVSPSGQLSEPGLRARQCSAVGDIELMTSVATSVHNDLDAHLLCLLGRRVDRCPLRPITWRWRLSSADAEA